MRDEYLWDGSGPPDPEVQRLEKLLARFRSRRPAGELPPAAPRRRLFLLGGALAAGLLVGLLGGALWLFSQRQPVGWKVVRLKGEPRVGGEPIDDTARLTIGEWLTTDEQSRARLLAGAVGQVDVDTGTRLRLLEASPGDHRLALERGTLYVVIWAPPLQFVVETQAAVAVDLGCAYSLKVDDTGSGVLRVSSGWVGFEWQGRESFVPAGARCLTRPGSGPGTPFFEDAASDLVKALQDFDFGGPSAEGLGVVLRQARKRDGMTLWHLLSRLDATDRGRVYDRLAALVPPPAGVTREGVLAGERVMLDLWWDAFGLGSARWWRQWKGSWPPGGA